jgi:hypothetical protein
VDISESEPKGKDWKILKKSGQTEYSDTAPSSNKDLDKVWGRSRHHMIITHYVGMGTVDSTPKSRWLRMYFYPKSSDWGVSPPERIDFLRNTERTQGLIGEIERTIHPELASKIESKRFDLINARGGASGSEEKIQAKIKEARDEIQSLCKQIGESLGIADLLWQIHQLQFDVDFQTTTSKTPSEYISRLNELKPLLRNLVARLTS